MKRSGLAQIPLMIGLLLMAIAVPVATKLVQTNQENRGKAYEAPECVYASDCGSATLWNCTGGKCVPKVTSTPIPTGTKNCPNYQTCGTTGSCVTYTGKQNVALSYVCQTSDSRCPNNCPQPTKVPTLGIPTLTPKPTSVPTKVPTVSTGQSAACKAAGGSCLTSSFPQCPSTTVLDNSLGCPVAYYMSAAVQGCCVPANKPNEEPCTFDSECASGNCMKYAGETKKCVAKLANGENCNVASNCISGKCVDYNLVGYKKCAPFPNGTDCINDGSCASGNCMKYAGENKKCVALLENGENCNINSNCKSNVCYMTKCVTSIPIFGTCSVSQVNQYRCDNGFSTQCQATSDSHMVIYYAWLPQGTYCTNGCETDTTSSNFGKCKTTVPTGTGTITPKLCPGTAAGGSCFGSLTLCKSIGYVPVEGSICVGSDMVCCKAGSSTTPIPTQACVKNDNCLIGGAACCSGYYVFDATCSTQLRCKVEVTPTPGCLQDPGLCSKNEQCCGGRCDFSGGTGVIGRCLTVPTTLPTLAPTNANCIRDGLCASSPQCCSGYCNIPQGKTSGYCMVLPTATPATCQCINNIYKGTGCGTNLNKPCGVTTVTPRPTDVPDGPTSKCTQCSGLPGAKGKGDADCSGATNINDASIWRSEFIEGELGITTKNSWHADFDCNGKVNLNDISIWRDNFIKGL